MKIACAFDHAGFPLKAVRARDRDGARPRAVDLGTGSTDPVDYPDVARRAAEIVLAGEADRAVIVCGSGAGVAIAACKFPGIRAFVGHDTYTAHQAVEHDDGNVLCMGGRVIGPLIAAEVLAAFCGAAFSRRGAPRAAARRRSTTIEREFASGA